MEVEQKGFGTVRTVRASSLVSGQQGCPVKAQQRKAGTDTTFNGSQGRLEKIDTQTRLFKQARKSNYTSGDSSSKPP